jgi:hypothetical protein
MLIAELEELVSSAPKEVEDYELYLAAPDTVVADNADEQTATIGGVELCVEQSEARLYPPFAAKDVDGGECVTLADLLTALRDDPAYQPELKLVAELPLIRDDDATYETTLVPVVEMHIGTEAQEVWLLLAPPAEFPANSLPA